MRSGFSLVELSIVLVILGLLTGGILTGQNLIRAAELRSLITQSQQFQTAVMTFRDKYFYIPGDMPNATDFWGAATAGGACNTTVAASGTCNGDGNGSIDNEGSASEYMEMYTAWQQLAFAGLIEGSYTGVAGGGSTYDHDPGENAPSTRISSAGWGIDTLTDSGGDGQRFNVNYGLVLMAGGANAGRPVLGFLTPEEMWNVDKKLDDGLPARGRVLVYGRTDCTDGANASDLDATYTLTHTDTDCSLHLRIN